MSNEQTKTAIGAALDEFYAVVNGTKCLVRILANYDAEVVYTVTDDEDGYLHIDMYHDGKIIWFKTLGIGNEFKPGEKITLCIPATIPLYDGPLYDGGN